MGKQTEVAKENTHLDNQDCESLDYEKEGEIAADYIEEFLDIADIDGDLDIEIKDGRTYISVSAFEDSNLNKLVGKNGKVLTALQELSRLAVLQNLNARSRFILDIQGYRNKKVEKLKALADQAVNDFMAEGIPIHMDPMGAYERKIIHDVVAKAGLSSESEGVGDARHVVVCREK